MPLSEHEQRLLAQMEQQLLADPKFASTMKGDKATARRRMALGVLGVLTGLVLLVLAVANTIIVLGVIAFLLMLAGAIYAFSSPKPKGYLGVVEDDGVRPPKSGHPASGGGFMQRLEDRWDRRRDDRYR